MKVWVCHFIQSALTLVSDCRFVGRQEEDLKYVYVLRPPQVYLATLPLEWWGSVDSLPF